MGEILILPIAEEHIPGYWKCLDQVARERRYIAMLEAPPFHTTLEFARANIQRGNVHLVALDGTTVVGWCDIIPHGLEGFRHSGELGMGLLAAYRGRGIGRRLLTEAIRRAWEMWLDRIELQVYASNQVARSLYESAGFVVEGVRRQARKLDGVHDDIVQMGLLREPGATPGGKARRGEPATGEPPGRDAAPAPLGPAITGLDHVHLAMPPGGEEKARAFYHGFLGLEEEEKPPGLKGRGGCWFRGPRTVVHIGVEPGFVASAKAHAAFTVRDLGALRQRLEGAGYPVIPDEAVEGVERFYTRDPFGNRLEFIKDGQGFAQRHRERP